VRGGDEDDLFEAGFSLVQGGGGGKARRVCFDLSGTTTTFLVGGGAQGSWEEDGLFSEDLA
jgi:hypothetical protein